VPPHPAAPSGGETMDIALVLISLAALAVMAGFIWAMERM
jgi:hypothetical protein